MGRKQGFPRGIARSGLSGDDNSITWTSKYGSVAASAYDVGTADGLNEKGLVVNALWLAASDYGKRDPRVPGLSLSLWTQYMLDNFATVAEADEHYGEYFRGESLPDKAVVLLRRLGYPDGDEALYRHIPRSRPLTERSP